MAKRKSSIILGSTLFLAAIATTLSISLYLTAPAETPALLRTGGEFLFSTFLYPAYYVGIFLFILAVLALRRDFQPASIQFMILSLVPFLTAALLFHLLLNPAPNALMRLLIVGFSGRRSAAGVLLLLLLVEVLLSLKIAFRRQPAVRRRAADDDEHEPPILRREELRAEESDDVSGALRLERDTAGNLRFSPDQEHEEGEEVPVELVEEEEPPVPPAFDEEPTILPVAGKVDEGGRTTRGVRSFPKATPEATIPSTPTMPTIPPFGGWFRILFAPRYLLRVNLRPRCSL